MSRGQLEGKANGCMRSAANWRGADSPRSADANIVDIFPARRPAQDLPTPLPGMGRDSGKANRRMEAQFAADAQCAVYYDWTQQQLVGPAAACRFERIPHMNAEDDMYEGYFVPKQGTMVMGNFLAPDATFGYGKRLWEVHGARFDVACILVTFTVEPTSGHPLPSEPLFESGLALHAKAETA
ncbi:hypothetical protein OF83DRAFT_1086242 [Amylostereum chailletii]|nr:hypothetical protein OF83DRAFT_1086242 [Amylostereum chailletii]